jgi:hypothetical protein
LKQERIAKMKLITSKVWTAGLATGLALLALNARSWALTATNSASVQGTSQIDISFDQPLDQTTASTLANYTVSGGAVVADVELHLDVSGGTTYSGVMLDISNSIPSNYTVTISNVKNAAGTETIAPNSVVSGTTLAVTGTDLDTVGTDPLLPGSVFAYGPGSFDMTGGGSDLYNNTDSGYVVYSDRTGDFDVAVQAESLVSSDTGAIPANNSAKTCIVVEEPVAGLPIGHIGSRHVYVAIQPATLPETADYGYFELDWKFATGSSAYMDPPDMPALYPNGWLRMKRVGNTFFTYYGPDGITWTNLGHVEPVPPYPDTVHVCLGVTSHDNTGPTVTAQLRNFGDYSYPAPQVFITRQPLNVAVGANGQASFSVAATATSGTNSVPARKIGYRWQKLVSGAFADLPGATAATYVTPFLTSADNGAQYRCVVSISGASVNSSVATLTVGADLTRPGLHHVVSLDPATVSVYFTEPVDATSANVSTNYGIDQGVTVAAAQQDANDPTLVTLTTSSLTLSNTYTLQVSGVKDLAGLAVPAGTQQTFLSQSYTYAATDLPILLPVSEMLPIGSLSNRGFALLFMQETNAYLGDDDLTAGFPYRNVEAGEDLLAGTLDTFETEFSPPYVFFDFALPSTGGASPVSTVETNIINYNTEDQLPSSIGSIPNDVAWPCLSNVLGSFVPYSGHAVMEARTYVQLQAGVHRFGCNASQFFRMSSARSADDPNRVVLAEQDITSGGSARTGVDPNFNAGAFIAPRDGLYPMRLVWLSNSASRPANCDWWQQDLTSGTPATAEAINASDDIQAFQPPAALQAGSLAATRATNGDIVFTWATGATLQVASQVKGPYADVVGSVSPHVELAAGGVKFYRLRF